MDQEQGTYRIEPGQGVEIDLFHPEDAEGVTRLFRTVYGECYPIRTFLEPKLLIAENASRRTISSIARTPKGDIVGHNALYQSAPQKSIYESGAGLVHPEYRGGKGIFTRLIAHGQDIGAKKFGVETIYGEPVCNHLFSQKAAASQGWVTQALEVDLMPASAYDNEQSARGRVTSLLDFETLKSKPHRVFLPSCYRKALNFLYDGFDDQRTFEWSDSVTPPEGRTSIRTEVFDFAAVARIAVYEAGADFTDSFAAREREVQEQGAVVIQVWLKLAWPWIGRIVEELRQRGYFLGGLLPRWFDVDGMLMQKILSRPNWEEIHLYSGRAKRILELLKEDWMRID